jgi:spore germination protein YaaH
MFLPSADLNAFGTFNPSFSSGGGEKDAVIYFFDGTEWTTAPLAMEAQLDKTDSIANSPLFYHNGIMWVKTDMFEEDVKGSKIMKVNLPLEQLAGKPDKPIDAIPSQLNEPIKNISKETAAGNVAPVLDQPSSKLEKNLSADNIKKPISLEPVKNEHVVKDIIVTEPAKTPLVKLEDKKPVVAPVVTKTPVTPAPKTITEPAKTPLVKIEDKKPVVAPVVTKIPVTTPAPKAITEPAKTPVVKVEDKKPVVAPVVTKTPAPSPSSSNKTVYKTIPGFEPAPVSTVTEAPKSVTAMNKPIIRNDIGPSVTTVTPFPYTAPSIVNSASPKVDIEIGVKPVNVPVIKPVVNTTVTEAPKAAGKPIITTTDKPKVLVEKAPTTIADAKPITISTNSDVNPNLASLPIKPLDKPIVNTVVADKPVTTPLVYAKPETDKPAVVVADSKPIVYAKLPDVKPTTDKPVFTPQVNPIAKTETMPLVYRPDYLKAKSKSVSILAPLPMVMSDAKPITMPLNYNLPVPNAHYENSSIAFKKERVPVPNLPSNFVFTLSAKQGTTQAPTDTVPKVVNPLTSFIKTPSDEVQAKEETLTQEPRKEDDAKKEEDAKKGKKKDKEAEPVAVTPVFSIDTIKKLIQDEINSAMGGKLPLSATMPGQTDTATVELPPSITINDSIEELRKLNQQLQAELDEKLMLRDKLEGQVDEQRQIKKEAKLGGDLGKKDTVKLSDESYVIREYKFALDNEIFGWHPYWMGESYRGYDYSLLTTLAYFSYELDPATGGYKTIHDWNSTDVIELAQEKGCKVVLTATCLNEKDLSLFLANNNAQDNFVKTIRDLIVERNANGVNINFEKLNYRYRSEFVDLIKKLNKSFKELNPAYQISITVPAIDYRDAYDVAELEPYVDLFIMMGYEYTGSYSNKTGPTAPLNGGATYAQYNLASSIDAYLKNKVPAKKLVLAIPYYGVQWEVEGYEVPGKEIKFIKSMSYAQIKAQYGDKEPFFYEASLTPYYNNPIPGRYNMFDQVWFDNARSLGMKFDMIMEKELGGVGIWALGMDGGNKEFWNILEDKFLKIVPVPMDTVVIKMAQTGGGFGSWIGSKFKRLVSILRRPSTYNPANSNFDSWLRIFMVIGGLTFIIARGRFVIRRLQMGSKYKASKPYLYVLITGIAIFTVSMLMWVRLTRFFERIYQSSSFLFTIGMILGIILAVIFILWILPKWLKNKELP